MTFRSFASPLLFASTLAAAVALLPVRASACSYALRLIEASYPVQGAVDVPTNAMLFIYGEQVSAATEVRLRDTTTGATISLEHHAAPSGLDLLPSEPLAPQRKYQLVVTPEASEGYYGEDIVEFTTGNAPAEAAPAPSAPQVDATVISYELGSCGVISKLCLQRAELPGTTLEVRMGEKVLSNPGGPWGWSLSYNAPIGDTECLQLRFRDALGRRSLPTVLCEADLRRVEVNGYNAPDGVSCDNYSQLIESSEGEEVAPPPDYVSPPEPGARPAPRPANATDLDDSSDGAELTPSGSRASSGCAMTPSSGGGGLAGLGLALGAYVVARRRSRR